MSNAPGILGEGVTGFHPDGRFVVVTTTLVNTFQVVDGMYSADMTDDAIVESETQGALDDPAAYIHDAEIAVQVKVFNHQGVAQA